MLKITTNAALAATVAMSGTIGIINAPMASAEETTTHTLESQAQLINGANIQGWTIRNLKISTDAIPYPVHGTLWEATATDEALQGSVTPIVSNLNARAESGQTYRALFQVATPQGVNPATLAQGQTTTGKVYFDVTGDRPDSVVYIAGGHDLLTWVEPPPAPAASTATPAPAASPAATAPDAGPPTPAPAAGPPTPAPAASPATNAPAAGPAATTPTDTEVIPPPSGSQGTPLGTGGQETALPVGSQGTPLPAGNEATPVPANPEGAPLPVSIGEVPLPEDSQGTPLPAGSEETPIPAITPTTTPVVAPPA